MIICKQSHLQIAPSVLKQLSPLLHKSQENRDTDSLDSLLPLLQMATHILNLLASSKQSSFANHCATNHTELQYCLHILNRVYKEKDDKLHGM